jgi:pyruvate/2-oxoglutarate dehydrogenase complex dihydrolipoamide dehydrogenase (E3) component
VPPIPGLAAAGYRTSDTVWALTALPRRLLVLGGGPIGCELAQAFARLGARVSLVERGPRLLAREDPEVSSLIAARFAAEGIEILCDSEVIAAERVAAGKRLSLRRGAATLAVEGDEILVAVGRTPNLEGLGLEALGIEVDPGQPIAVDDYLQTLHPNIHACGDVVGPFQFTHVASHQAWYATVNALFGRFRRFRVDYRVIPRATFTAPEVARVGLNEQEAHERGIPCEVTTCTLGTLDRAVTDGEAEGFVKVLTVPGRDRILGVTIVGAHAAEVLPEFVLAMRHGLGLNAILGTIHVYPSFGEAAKRVAGEWRRGRVTEGQLRWLAAFHAWQRGAAGFASVLAALGALWRNRRRAGSGGPGA